MALLPLPSINQLPEDADDALNTYGEMFIVGERGIGPCLWIDALNEPKAGNAERSQVVLIISNTLQNRRLRNTHMCAIIPPVPSTPLQHQINRYCGIHLTEPEITSDLRMLNQHAQALRYVLTIRHCSKSSWVIYRRPAVRRLARPRIFFAIRDLYTPLVSAFPQGFALNLSDDPFSLRKFSAGGMKAW